MPDWTALNFDFSTYHFLFTFASGDTEVDAVVITGQRPDGYKEVYEFDRFDPLYSRFLTELHHGRLPSVDSIYVRTGSIDLTPDEPVVYTADISPQGMLAYHRLVEAVHAATMQIDGLSDNATVAMADGTFLRGSEIKAQWHSMSFTVTESDPGPGRGGANFDGHVDMSKATVNGYFGLGGTQGIVSMLWHEVGHDTPLGQQIDADSWLGYLENNAGPDARANYPDSIEFLINELSTNAIARDMYEQLGFGVYRDYTGLGYWW